MEFGFGAGVGEGAGVVAVAYINIYSHHASSLDGHMSRITLVRRENT